MLNSCFIKVIQYDIKLCILSNDRGIYSINKFNILKFTIVKILSDIHIIYNRLNI